MWNTKTLTFEDVQVFLFTVLVILIFSCKKEDDSPIQKRIPFDTEKTCIDSTKISTLTCSYEYNPVCGCNEITYSNPCYAKKAGLQQYKFGACSASSCINPNLINDSIDCDETYKPVCGCNGITYKNSCEAKKQGIVQYTKGTCYSGLCIDPSKVNPNIPCPTDYDPVCGCDGKTYGNACDAERAGVNHFFQGICQTGPCIDSTLIQYNTNINNIPYEPVCGCDGKTYRHWYIARNIFGLTAWKKGTCP